MISGTESTRNPQKGTRNPNCLERPLSVGPGGGASGFTILGAVGFGSASLAEVSGGSG